MDLTTQLRALEEGSQFLSLRLSPANDVWKTRLIFVKEIEQLLLPYISWLKIDE